MISQVWYDSRHSRKLLKKQMPKTTKTTMVLLHPDLYQMWVKSCTIKEETLNNWYIWVHAKIQQFLSIHSPKEVKIIFFLGHFLYSTQSLTFLLPGSKIKLCILTGSELAAPAEFSLNLKLSFACLLMTKFTSNESSNDRTEIPSKANSKDH